MDLSNAARDATRVASVALVVLVSFFGFNGCGKPAESPVKSFVDEPFPKKLSEWHLFAGESALSQPNQRVLPYDLNTPLFSDYASKHRFVWMPPGASAKYREDSVFDFPVGTIFVKSFAFPANDDSTTERFVETRLLVHSKSGWVGLPYIWNAGQTEATLELVPDPVHIRYVDSSGKNRDFTYFIPNANECKQCHDNERVMLPIGPKARNLNKDFIYSDGAENQLARWTKVGYLQGTPSPETLPKVSRWDVPSSGTLEARARAYLDNNCAHCHQPGGTGGYTALDLRIASSNPKALGECKSPNSAGRVGSLTYDLIPGHPEESILLARMESTRPKEMMPQIGRSVVHEEGVALIREWIRSLPGEGISCAQSVSR
jgi:uncharacterized repeat protein (TIGR03806 family)